MAELSKASNARAFADLLMHYGAILAIVATAHAAGHWLVYLLAVVAIGGLQNRLLVLAHECWHRKAFQPVALNQLIGRWFYSYAVGVPFLADQKRHLAHHRLVGREEDPDWPDYERPEFRSPAGVLLFLLAQLLGAKLVLRGLYALRRGDSRLELRAEAGKAEMPFVAVAQLVILACFALFASWWEYLLLWLLPLFTVASFLISFRALIEHANAEPGCTPHERLYDFDAGALSRLFVSPFLFHIHALHHAYPSVPHYRLRALQARLEREGVSYPAIKRPGYLRSYAEYLGRLRDAGAANAEPLR